MSCADLAVDPGFRWRSIRELDSGFARERAPE